MRFMHFEFKYVVMHEMMLSIKIKSYFFEILDLIRTNAQLGGKFKPVY